MIVLPIKSKCSGCTACYSICPKSAIEMIADKEGFKYPVVNSEKCINCSLCDKICPENEPYFGNRDNLSEKYAVQSKNDEARFQSTAGGFFSVIADYVIENLHGAVFACGFDSGTVVHKKATLLSETIEMRGSKYVQSDLRDTFKEVKRLLDENTVCLFVGTPCQVNGISKFLDKNINRRNLITIDLLCLGVSSPLIYDKWLDYLKEKYKKFIKTVYFREKSYGYATANVRVVFDDNKYIEQCYDAKSCMNTFFRHINMRPSCYECAFRCVERSGDFTMGDFHQIGKYCPELDDDKGTTCVWANSDKSKEILRTLSDKMHCVLIEDRVSHKLFDKSKFFDPPERRAAFFSDADRLPFKTMITTYVHNGIKSKTINISRRFINKLPFRSFVFKTIKKVKMKNFQKIVNSSKK